MAVLAIRCGGRRRQGRQAAGRGLDLHTVGDLLGHYPRRYDKRGELTDLAGLRDGEHVTVQAEVAKVSRRPDAQPAGIDLRGHRDRRARAADADVLRPGRRLARAASSSPASAACSPARCPASAASASSPTPTMSCSARAAGARADEFAAELIPVYPASAKMRPGRSPTRSGSPWTCWTCRMTRCRLRSAHGHGLCGYADALRGIHRPVDEADVQRARTG